MRLIVHLAASLAALPALVSAQEAGFLSRTRQLTLEGRRAGEGYFNADGTKLIFQSEREPDNPFYQIYILDFETGRAGRVSPGVGKTTCAFFRPGTNRVLFASTHLDPRSADLQRAELAERAAGRQRRYAWDYDPHFDLFETGQDGSDPVRLTDAFGYDAEASYSPDGSKIVFTSMREAYPLERLSDRERRLAEVDLAYFGDIYLMNADGTGVRRLTSTPGYDGGPFFSPDGQRIIWRRFDEAGLKADVYTMKLDGADVRRLTDFGSMSWAPFYHPSGDYVIFASNKLGFENFELFVVDALGAREPVRVTFTDGFDGLPVFSPDGRRLCWTSSRHQRGAGDGAQLYLADWNDAGARAALASAPPRPAEASVLARTPAITEDELRADVAFLAGEALEGRLTGEPGELRAAEYIARALAAAGLKPLPGRPDPFFEFEFTAGVRPGEANRLALWTVEPNPHKPLDQRKQAGRLEMEFAAGRAFNPLGIAEEGSVEGSVAFVGYGLVARDDQEEIIYDSFADVDVAGRVVLALRYVPEAVEPTRRQVLNRFAGLRFKALQARERGATALLVVTGPNSPGAGELIGLGLDAGAAGSGLPAASVDLATADRLLRSSGKTLAELQSALDPGEPLRGFVLEDSLVELGVDLIKERRTGRNVIAWIEPAGGMAPDGEYVAIGAHYDHLGRGGGGNSLARQGEEGAVHPGADDNASGVAALIQIAEALAERREGWRRGVIVAAWSGEELGLLGSGAFCKDPPIPLDRVVGYLNLDMVGRIRENRLMVQGVGSSPDWAGPLERANAVVGFDLKLSDDPYLPTDVMSFYLQQVPSLHFFSGAHEDYHRPTDTADKLDYAETVRVAEFVRRVARELATGQSRPAYARVERPSGPAGGRETLRAYLGTIPDYAEEIEGVKLAGVQAGGPAEKAGLKGGDVIVEFAGQKVTNIYDYTYALEAVRIGEPIKVAVLRDGRRMEVEVVPEARR